MSTKIDTTQLKKALKDLKDLHHGIKEAEDSLAEMHRQHDEAMENTSLKDESAVQSIAALRVKMELVPKFSVKKMTQREALYQSLIAAFEPVWLQIEEVLKQEQEGFKNRWEKTIAPVFGDLSRDLLCRSPKYPAANWTEEDRGFLSTVFRNPNGAGDPQEDYKMKLPYDLKVIKGAERLLVIADNPILHAAA